MQGRSLKIGIGAAMWLVAGLCIAWASQDKVREFQAPATKLANYLGSRPVDMERFLPGHLRVGDPVLGPDRSYLGRVVEIRDARTGAPALRTWDLPEAEHYRVRIRLDPEVELGSDPQFETRRAGHDARWILETLLPPPKRDLVMRELARFLDDHQDEVGRFLRPLAEEVVAEAMRVLEENLSAALNSRSAEIQGLLDRHRAMVKDEILPVLKEQLGPSAKEKAQPILTEIGRELWQELPMWSVTWRAVADWAPGTRDDRVQAWWSEFVETTAIPIVTAHEADLIVALEELIEEGAANPEVRRVLSGATHRLARDPQFRALVRGVIEDALIRPFELRAFMGRLLEDPQHLARLRALERAIAPYLQRIAKLITTDPETGGIDPDLARVLRRTVFNKDARWVELVPAEAP
jgi:hypothetical protein